VEGLSPNEGIAFGAYALDSGQLGVPVMSALTAFGTAESTFLDVFAGHAERNPDQPALVALGFAPISYRDLLVQTGKIWDCLRDAGIKYGSQIGIALPSGPESAITTIAIAAHATCVPL
jgi:acyl-CoA synthetase (AMP-forming)/AMP-acid ligase II